MPPGDKALRTLSEFIACINAQSGGFRSLREEDLRKEIEAQQNGGSNTPGDVNMTDATEGEGEDESGREPDPLENLRLARDEMLKNIEYGRRAP